MFLSIGLWQESGMSQRAFCDRENLSMPAFCYWLRKYKKEKGQASEPNSGESFIPVLVPGIKPEVQANRILDTDKIIICFPNGVQVAIPVGTDIDRLKNLIRY